MCENTSILIDQHRIATLPKTCRLQQAGYTYIEVVKTAQGPQDFSSTRGLNRDSDSENIVIKRGRTKRLRKMHSPIQGRSYRDVGNRLVLMI